MIVIIVLAFVFFLFFSPVSAYDVELEHSKSQAHTIFINQVRGTTCCDVGSAEYFKNQVATFSDLDMAATFTLRYDTLSDAAFLSTIENSPEVIEYGGFLEIIPSLAEDAGVSYFGTNETWYEAQYAFLIGYSQPDRKKLIDTFMEKYFQVFNRYPKVTTAWMIDAWSLQYLKQQYGVVIHQITREQYGTDSYALYGGPPHYPYWPSDTWALIPSQTAPSATMPLIVRQTITDPVENYGDDSSLHTSQPNDYLQDPQQTIAYFQYLFEQAHQQPQPVSTFALLGLENSMDQVFQDEFEQQLKIVNQWQEQLPQQQVVSATDFEQWYKQQTVPAIRVYSGAVYGSEDESKAWWITTSRYRARLRLDGESLYITDLRVYDRSFADPYLLDKAENLGWWIVPFSLDGSRFFYNQENPEPNQLALDSITNRKEKDGIPTHILISDAADLLFKSDQNSFNVIDKNGNSLASFAATDFSVTTNAQKMIAHPWLDIVLDDLIWLSKTDAKLWGFDASPVNDGTKYQPYVSADSKALDQQRQTRYPLLFPELAARPLDIEKSYLYINNQYAIVGRNPVRLVLFPRDEYDMPTLLETEPEVSTKSEISEITLKRQHGNSGMIFMDFESDTPMQTTANARSGNFGRSHSIYFAPNCKQQVIYCLTHPQQAWWYIQAILDDRRRAAQEE